MNLKKKDRRLRFFVNLFEKKKQIFYYLSYSSCLEGYYRYFLSKSFFFLNKGFLMKVRNRCVVSFRSRSVLRKFKISRHIFKKYSSYGILSGVKRHSW